MKDWTIYSEQVIPTIVRTAIEAETKEEAEQKFKAIHNKEAKMVHIEQSKLKEYKDSYKDYLKYRKAV